MTIITSDLQNSLQLRTQEDVDNYIQQLNNLSSDDFYQEFMNILNAKYHLTSLPYNNPLVANEKQQIVAELNDKIFIICMLKFGKDFLNSFNGDLRYFNQIVEEIDNQVNLLNLDGISHSKKVLSELSKFILENKKDTPPIKSNNETFTNIKRNEEVQNNDNKIIITIVLITIVFIIILLNI